MKLVAGDSAGSLNIVSRQPHRLQRALQPLFQQAATVMCNPVELGTPLGSELFLDNEKRRDRNRQSNGRYQPDYGMFLDQVDKIGELS